MSFYKIVLFDQEDCEMVSRPDVAGLNIARKEATELLNDPEYTDAMTVEVQDDNGVCVWDKSR